VVDDPRVISARMYIRGSVYSNLKFLEEIGWRKNKCFFLVDNPHAKGEGKFVMQMSSIGKNCEIFQHPSATKAFVTLMQSIQHPFIMPSSEVMHQSDRNVVVLFRSYVPKGSLKDFIHRAKPIQPYRRKYSTVSGEPLTESKIALFGRQILEGLDYLKSQKIPYISLSAGNVLVDNGVCRLTDYENAFIDLPPKIQPIFGANAENVDPLVISFGYLLYEMAIGFELGAPLIDENDIPPKCNSKVKKILMSMFPIGPNCPSIRDLLALPFFDVSLYSEWVPHDIPTDPSIKKLLENASRIDISLKNMKVDVSSPTSPRSKEKPKTTKSKTKKKSTKNTKSNIPPPPSAPPPPSGAPIPPPPPPSSSTPGRGQLLSSITGFNTKKLKKVKTKDRSVPILKKG